MTLRALGVSAALLIVATTAFATLNVPADITAEAKGPGGAVIEWNVGITDGPDDVNGRPTTSATCSPASRSLFALGTTTVVCTGSDGSNGSFHVTVVDSTGPALNLPRDFALTAPNESGVSATFDATATDIVDGAVSVACSPASGSLFPIGKTHVSCSATDSRQNTSRGGFDLLVYRQSPPPPPPPPGEQTITVEATGPDGAVVNFAGSGTGPDDANGRPAGNCSAASGTRFPLGTTIVTCSTVTLTVHVVDTTPPELSLPSTITKAATSADGATVSFNASAHDLVDGNVAVTCAPASGSTFSVGSTTVQCSASDTRSNAANGAFVVQVTANDDTTAPDILSISATPNTLAPPNGEMRSVTVSVSVHDAGDPLPIVRIYDVTSNEAITSADWTITGLLTVNLRAQRDGGGSGRVYTIHVEAIDAAGNRGVATVDVNVPHDQGNGSSPVTTPAPVPGRRRSVRG
jgi:hypothetical protein